MSKTSIRITKELSKLEENPLPGISISMKDNNIRYLGILMEGPPDTPFEGGIFELELYLPAEYPMVPPMVRFLTKVYHPNIDKIGRICLDIIKDKWSPALQINTVVISIQNLLNDPNPDDPLNASVAEHWKSDLKDAHATARSWTAQYTK